MPTATMTALRSAMNTLAAGSAFFHGSGTTLGDLLDDTPIGQIALTSYQAAVYPLARSTIIADISPTPVGVNGTDLAFNQSLILANSSNLYLWKGRIGAMYQPDYIVVFGANVILIARLTLPAEFVTKCLPIFASLFELSPNETDFLLHHYDPAIQQAYQQQGIAPSKTVALALLARGIGTVIKLMYAFVWQEGVFKGPYLRSESANRFGGELMPLVNLLADSLTGYYHPADVRTGVEVYPGDSVCRNLVAHAKWHEESANGLVDLIYLTDDTHLVLLGHNLSIPATGSAIPAVAAALDGGCFDDLAPELEAMVQRLGPCASRPWPDRLSCIVSQLVAGALGSSSSSAAAAAAAAEEEPEAGFMDTCMMAHLCFDSQAESALDCISAHCSQHLASTASFVFLRLCGITCPSGQGALTMACHAQCLRQHTALSPLASAAIDCLGTFDGASSPAAGLLHFASCVAQRRNELAAPAPFFTALHDALACTLTYIGRDPE
jgi:hypothetical protein